MSHAGTSAAVADGRTSSPLRWLALALAATAIFSSYYESDALGPLADLLGRQDVQEMIDTIKKTHPALVDDVIE